MLQKWHFFCCKTDAEEAPQSRLIEPSYKPPLKMATTDGYLLLWRLHLVKIDGLDICGGVCLVALFMNALNLTLFQANLVFKATYAGRTMFSDALRFDMYRKECECQFCYFQQSTPKPALSLSPFVPQH